MYNNKIKKGESETVKGGSPSVVLIKVVLAVFPNLNEPKKQNSINSEINLFLESCLL